MDISVPLRFFRALADESRLKIVGLLASDPRSVEELAALVGLKAPTVSHHLGRLQEAGLVSMRAKGTSHLYSLETGPLREMSRTVLRRERIASLADDVSADAWERKILRDFFEGERLIQIPTGHRKRLVVLRWLAGRFEPGVCYREKSVNEILCRHHPDVAFLRREMVGFKLLERERGVYRRVES